MRYFLSSFVGLVVGAIIGAVLGVIADIIMGMLLSPSPLRGAFYDMHYNRLRITLLALGGAFLVGLFGLIIAQAIAFIRRPKASAPIQG